MQESSQPQEIKRPWWIPSWSMVTWVVIFGALAMLVPIDWIRGVQDTVIPETLRPERAFSPDAARLDAALERGEPAPGARAIKIELQVRRVAATGPVAGDHIPRLMELLRTMNALAFVEKSQGGKRAVRAYHAEKIARELGRLEQSRVLEALEALEVQLERVASSP